MNNIKKSIILATLPIIALMSIGAYQNDWLTRTIADTLYATATHATQHTDGTDDIQNATAAQKGLATATQITKLDGIEALADVTDWTNVAAAAAAATGTLDLNGQTITNVGNVDGVDVSGILSATWTNVDAALSAAAGDVDLNGQALTNLGNLTVGAGGAGVDYTLSFDGETTDGVMTWDEDNGILTFDKEMTSGIPTASYATDQTLTAAECGGYVIYVTGAATITLPAVADGASVTIITIGAVAVSVDPNASDKILLDGTALDDGDKITNTSTAGDVAVLTYYSADGWHASTNTWTDGG